MSVLKKGLKIRLTEAMIRQCPGISEEDMAKNDNMMGFCKGAYWKSFNPNPLEVDEPLVPYHLAAPKQIKLYLMCRKGRSINRMSDFLNWNVR